MLSNFLLPERTVVTDGRGPAVDLGFRPGSRRYLTLGITRITEHELLEVSVWGSMDGEHWGSRPLATYPPKFYCGIYSILLNLVSSTEIRYLRVQWKMSRWSKREVTPMFGFYLYAEESGARVGAAAVA